MDKIKKSISSIQGKIESVKTSFLYKIGIFVVFIFMVILPLIYMSLIAGTGSLVYYHTVYNHTIISGGVILFKLILYISPIVIGCVLLFFMIKPLFLKRHLEDSSIEIRQSEEPVLFEFIEKLCLIVEAPIPKRILINTDVNASASFSPGLFSFFTSNLTLTIGLPLILGLNIQQLGGILAHEFGHFAQGAGMRLTLIIRQINLWFAFIVSERTNMDNMLVSGANKTDARFGIVLIIARVFVWFTSNILELLMQIGNTISGFLLRQMEFDADRYEIAFSGSKCFEETFGKMKQFSFAYHFSFMNLRDAWHEQKLTKNFPQYILEYLDRHEKTIKSSIIENQAYEKTSLQDTHPPDSARILKAKKENLPGMFNSQILAKQLFSDIEKLASQSTLKLFQVNIDPDIREENLVDNNDIFIMQKKMEDDFNKLMDYTLGVLSLNRPVNIFDNKKNEVEKDFFIEEIKSIHEYQNCNYGKAFTELEKYEKLEDLKLAALQAENLIQSGFKISKDQFSLDTPSIENSKLKYIEYKKEQDSLNFISEYMRYIEKKFCFTLSYFETVNSKNSTIFKKYKILKSAYTTLIASFKDMQKLRNNYGILSVLVENIFRDSTNESLNKRVTYFINNSYDLIENLSAAFKKSRYPYDNEKEILLNEYFFHAIPAKSEQPEIFNFIETVIDKYYSLYSRIISEFASIAIDIEKSLDVKTLSYISDDSNSPDFSVPDKEYLPIWEKYGPYISLVILITIIIIINYIPTSNFNFQKRNNPVKVISVNPPPGLVKSVPSFHGNYAVLYVDNIIDTEFELYIITVREYLEAEKVITLLDGGDEFGILASRMSLHPSSNKKGYLGKFQLSDLNEAFKEALNDLKKGQHSKIIPLNSN